MQKTSTQLRKSDFISNTDFKIANKDYRTKFIVEKLFCINNFR